MILKKVKIKKGKKKKGKSKEVKVKIFCIRIYVHVFVHIQMNRYLKSEKFLRLSKVRHPWICENRPKTQNSLFCCLGMETMDRRKYC